MTNGTGRTAGWMQTLDASWGVEWVKTLRRSLAMVTGRKRR